jgi:hypothetical protein
MSQMKTVGAIVAAIALGAALGTTVPAIARSYGIALPTCSDTCANEAGTAGSGTGCTDCAPAPATTTAPTAPAAAPSCTDCAPSGSTTCAPSSTGCPDCQ